MDKDRIDEKSDKMQALETVKRALLTRELDKLRAELLEKEKLLRVTASKNEEF